MKTISQKRQNQSQQKRENLIFTNFSRNQKSPINKDDLKKYSPQNQLKLKCLPAKFSSKPIYGQLMIKFESMVLNSNTLISKIKHVIYRCRMLGYQSQQSPFLSQNITYTIHTNNKMFKHYLKDMKICLVEVLDARNYQPIGHSYINWLTHMRSIEDNQPIIDKNQSENKYEYDPNSVKKYYLPFLDEQCQIKLPLYDYRNPKIELKSPTHTKKIENQNSIPTIKMNSKQRIVGEISIRFMCRIYEKPIALGYDVPSQQNIRSPIPTSDLNIQQNFLSQNQNKNSVSPSYLDLPNSRKFISNKNITSSKSISQSPTNNYNADHNIQSNTGQNNQYLQLQRQPSNFSSQNQRTHGNKLGGKILFNNFYKGDGQYNNSRIYSSKNEDYEKANLNIIEKQKATLKNKSKTAITQQLQLLQLKLDGQEFLKTIGNQVQTNKKQQKIIIQIVKLRSKLQNINQLDVYLTQGQEQQKDDKEQYLNNKPHIKIFKISKQTLKNQDFFKSQIIVQRASERIIQVHLPNSQGKCVFRCKDLTGKNNQICVYNKGMIIGMLTIRKQITPTNILSPVLNVDNLNNLNSKSPVKPLTQNLNQDKIAILVIENFNEHFLKSVKNNQMQHLDNYYISIKNLQFFHQTLVNSKFTGEYAVTNSIYLPKLFAVEVKNSENQFVGMSQNINFEGNQIQLFDQNIMPTLICQRNIRINLKQMPVFKKIPNSISFRFSIYISNTVQLNYFISKWKENQKKGQNLNFTKKQNLSQNAIIQRTVLNQKNQRQKFNSISEGQHQNKYFIKKSSLESQNERKVLRNKTQSKESQRQNTINERFKTQGNYTEDLNSQGKPRLKSQQKQNTEQYSMQQKQVQDYQEEIYLVQFFCKSLHFILGKLGSKKLIQQKLAQLKNYEYLNQSQQKSVSGQSSLTNSGTVSKEQFQRILLLLIGQNKQNIEQNLQFNPNQILQALFTSEGGTMIKLQEFVLCLMAYYNFLLLLNNEKLVALKQLLSCQPEAQKKLQKIQSSITNINSQFLWEDILTNTFQKTKQKVNKRYRINPNTPFSINFLLKDLNMAKKSIQNPSDQSSINQLLTAFLNTSDKKEQIFMRITADLGNLVRQTVEQIILSRNLENSNVDFDRQWIQHMNTKIETFIQKQKQMQTESISTQGKGDFQFNLTQFQEFFSNIQIQTSIWESLMLIQEIKIWHQNDQMKQKNYIEAGQGVISVQLLKNWFKALNTKIQIKNQKGLIKKSDGKNSRVASVKSINSEEDIIDQINKKLLEHKKPALKQSGSYYRGAQFNEIEGQENGSIFKHYDALNEKKKTEKNSIKSSQMINNQSDIANIANLLKQNENNLYFLPSLTDPKTINKIGSANILSNQNILKGLQENTLRVGSEALTSKPNNVLPIKQDESKDYSQKQMKDQDEQQQSKQYIIQNQISQYHFMSISIQQIKLKKKQIALNKLGLKKLMISFKKQSYSDENDNNTQNNQNDDKVHFFLSQQSISKIFEQEFQQALQKYQLINFPIDINNLYKIETLYSQGLSIQLMNLAQKNYQKNKKNRQISIDNKVQQRIFSGILPIQDIIKVMEQYKVKLSKRQNKSEENTNYSKRKTIVLYSGRQINGKIVVQIKVSNKKSLQHILKSSIHQNINFTTVQLSFKLKENKKQKNKRIGEHLIPTLMELSYCSIRDQTNTILLIPVIADNDIYEINLPQPIIQHQLILRPVALPKTKNQQNVIKFEQSGLNVSLLTRKQNSTIKIDESSGKSIEQCIIPLQTLYFKKEVIQEYPMIDRQNGCFTCALKVQMKVI